MNAEKPGDTCNDLKNEILIAVNEALEGTGYSIARGTRDGRDFYALTKEGLVVRGMNDTDGPADV